MRTPIHLGPTAPSPSRDAIKAKVTEFLKAGRSIERVPGFVDVAPMPLRTEPKKKVIRRNKAMEATHLQRRAEIFRKYADEVARLFEQGVLISEITRALGISRERVNLCLEHKGIDRHAPRGEPRAKPQKLIDSMRALAAERYTARYAAQIIGMECDALNDLARKHDIRFREPAES